MTGNTYKVRSFGMAVTAIKKLDFEVRHGNDLKGVRPTLHAFIYGASDRACCYICR